MEETKKCAVCGNELDKCTCPKTESPEVKETTEETPAE
jgi:hypothetical protein